MYVAVVDTLFPWFCKRNFVNNAVPTQWHYRIHLFSGQTTKQARYLIFRQTNKFVKFTILFIWWISMFASFRFQIWLRKVRFGKRKVFSTQLWWTLKIWPYLFELLWRHSFKQHADKSMQFKDVYLSRLSCVKKVYTICEITWRVKARFIFEVSKNAKICGARKNNGKWRHLISFPFLPWKLLVQ